MNKLKIESIFDEKPVKLTIELPADVDRDLKAYAEFIEVESARSLTDRARLIVPMLKRFMATDRAFRKFRRQDTKEKTT